MFTGLIQDVGRVALLRPGPTTRLVVETAIDLKDVVLGESIAVDGCCLTVVEIGKGSVAFDASDETLRRTSLGGYQVGSAVNLERALALGDRLGGHLVLGHVDATTTILRCWQEGGSLWLDVALPREFAPYFIEKGSVALDGTSLTVNTLAADRFGVTLIPETQERTTLAKKPVGARLNLEADLIGKYVARLMTFRGQAGAVGPAGEASQKGIDLDFIQKAGWGGAR